MVYFTLELLQRLNKQSCQLNDELEEINRLLDLCNENIEAMASITYRIAKIFKLYKDLLKEMDLLKSNYMQSKDCIKES